MMYDSFPRYKVASVQAAPVFLDCQATIEKACRLINEAALNGAALVVFPETWVPGYPVWINTAARWNYLPEKRVFARFFKNSVDVAGPVTERLAHVAREHNSHVVSG